MSRGFLGNMPKGQGIGFQGQRKAMLQKIGKESNGRPSVVSRREKWSILLQDESLLILQSEKIEIPLLESRKTTQHTLLFT